MTQANFAACCAFVRKQEGGNTQTPGDRGGRTGRGGITHTTYDAYRAHMGFPLRDVFLISDGEISDIYAAGYWTPIHGDSLPAGEDLALFDYAINSGPAKANAARLAAGDGDTAALIHRICGGRLSFLHALGSWSRFGTGWGRRVAECETLALRMAGGLTSDVADNARSRTDVKRRRAPQIIAGAGGVVIGALHFGISHWAIAFIFVIAAAGVAISMFNTKRHAQRADALSTAVTQMRTAALIAATTHAAADSEVAIKAKTIEKEQAVLADAKEKIIALATSLK